MPLNCGIVGLPNVGKSTIFNALTSAKAQAANYPFSCTIDPNTGTVTVPDTSMVSPRSARGQIKLDQLVPTSMEFIDIAGLVEGASKGEGLGNQFLGHIRSTDAILHVVRCFADPEVVHVAGGVNPLHDIDIINTELLLADLDTVEKRYAKVEKLNKPANADHKIKTEFSALTKLKAALEEGKPARTVELTDDEKRPMDARPPPDPPPSRMLYVANVDDSGLSGHNEWVDARCEKRAAEEHSEVVSICGSMESEIAQLDAAERGEFLKAAWASPSPASTASSTPTPTRCSNLITYFTAGVQEVRAWTIVKGTKARRRQERNPHRLRKGLHQS